MELKIKNENKKKEIDKNKELLISLIKLKLENRLSKLERRNKMHLNIMNITTQTIKDITKWSININNQIMEKTKKNNKQVTKVAQKTLNKNKKFEKIEIRSNTRKQSIRSKTPLRNKSTKHFIAVETKPLTVNRNNIKSRQYLNLDTKTDKLIDSRTKSNTFIIKKKNLNLETEVLRRPSIMSNKSNKTSIPKKNKNAETSIRKKTPLKKKIEKTEKNNLSIKLNENKSNENVINSKIIKRVQKKEDDITKMETALQKGEYLTNNDPLLISPITDLDFFIDKKKSNSDISISNSDIKEIEKLNILFDNIDKNIYSKIIDFLDMDDLIRFKNASKFFHNLFIVYIENFLQNDMIYFNKKLKNINTDDSIPKRMTLDEFNISNKTLKAIKLLNEPSMKQFFFEETPADENSKLMVVLIIIMQNK